MAHDSVQSQRWVPQETASIPYVGIKLPKYLLSQSAISRYEIRNDIITQINPCM
jgi:hypothetical protein